MATEWRLLKRVASWSVELKLLTRTGDNGSDEFRLEVATAQGTNGQSFFTEAEARDAFDQAAVLAKIVQEPEPERPVMPETPKDVYFEYFYRLSAEAPYSDTVNVIRDEMMADPRVKDSPGAIRDFAGGSGWVNAAIRSSLNYLDELEQLEAVQRVAHVQGFGRF